MRMTIFQAIDTHGNETSKCGRRGGRWTVLLSVGLIGCGATPPESSTDAPWATEHQAVVEDALAEPYARFVDAATQRLWDKFRSMSLGFHPGLCTEHLTDGLGRPAQGFVNFDVQAGNVNGFFGGLPDGMYELWFVKNISTGTILPEAADKMLQVAKFTSGRDFSVTTGSKVTFDLDLAVVTRQGQTPVQSRLAVGERGLFEKRYFRSLAGESLDPVTGQQAANVETTDPLVARGAELFFEETFGGNGRTCGTCHRAAHNFTIDAGFIATLPANDPLFVAENVPALAGLEDTSLLRTRGLIRVSADGFDASHPPVQRGVPHILSLATTAALPAASGFPIQPLGWGGDGAPGRGSLHEFGFGAIMQHAPKTLNRRPGIDFRIPTQAELDALEAFQLFLGQQTRRNFLELIPGDASAANGREVIGRAGCTFCHRDLGGLRPQGSQTDVARLTPDLPVDDGKGTPGSGFFDAPPLAEAADTGPFFHNNAAATIEDAVAFYQSSVFRSSPAFRDLTLEHVPVDLLTPAEQSDLADFLRVVNAAFNLDQVRKRISYVRDVRSPGNTDILTITIADLRDANRVLADKNLSPTTRGYLRTIESLLTDALTLDDVSRPTLMGNLIVLLNRGTAPLFTND